MGGGFGEREVVVRLNGVDTEWFQEDLEEICKARPSAIVLPKVRAACRNEVFHMLRGAQVLFVVKKGIGLFLFLLLFSVRTYRWEAGTLSMMCARRWTRWVLLRAWACGR